MKILFLTSRLPYPPNRGDRLRTYHFLRTMSQEHSITLVSFVENKEEEKLTEGLAAFCDVIHTVHLPLYQSIAATALNFWRKEPLQTLYYRSAKMKNLIDKLIKENDFDLAVIHLFRMAQYLAEQKKMFRVVDLTDVISKEIGLAQQYRKGIKKFIYSLERKRIMAYELQLVREFNEIWLISAAESDLLSQGGNGDKIKVVTNGVNLDNFYPQDTILESKVKKSILFVGHMGVFHNINAAEYLAKDILPLVKKSVPDCKMIFAGTEADKTLTELAKNDGVEVKGFVEDLNFLLNSVTLFAAPLRFSAGVQNKVLEAMATKLPVVTTSLVNKGLNAKPEAELLIGDNPQEIADKIIVLLNDAHMRAKIGTAGFDFVKKNFSWNAVNVRLKEISTELQ